MTAGVAECGSRFLHKPALVVSSVILLLVLALVVGWFGRTVVRLMREG